MDSSEFNPEKKGMQVAGFVLTLICLIGVIVYAILRWCVVLFDNTDVVNWCILIAIFVVIGIGSSLLVASQKKKLGTQKQIRTGIILAYIALAATIICMILNWLIH